MWVLFDLLDNHTHVPIKHQLFAVTAMHTNSRCACKDGETIGYNIKSFEVQLYYK